MLKKAIGIEPRPKVVKPVVAEVEEEERRRVKRKARRRTRRRTVLESQSPARAEEKILETTAVKMKTMLRNPNLLK